MPGDKLVHEETPELQAQRDRPDQKDFPVHRVKLDRRVIPGRRDHPEKREAPDSRVRSATSERPAYRDRSVIRVRPVSKDSGVSWDLRAIPAARDQQVLQAILDGWDRSDRAEEPDPRARQARPESRASPE